MIDRIPRRLRLAFTRPDPPRNPLDPSIEIAAASR